MVKNIWFVQGTLRRYFPCYYRYDQFSKITSDVITDVVVQEPTQVNEFTALDEFQFSHSNICDNDLIIYIDLQTAETALANLYHLLPHPRIHVFILAESKFLQKQKTIVAMLAAYPSHNVHCLESKLQFSQQLEHLIGICCTRPCSFRIVSRRVKNIKQYQHYICTTNIAIYIIAHYSDIVTQRNCIKSNGIESIHKYITDFIDNFTFENLRHLAKHLRDMKIERVKLWDILASLVDARVIKTEMLQKILGIHLLLSVKNLYEKYQVFHRAGDLFRSNGSRLSVSKLNREIHIPDVLLEQLYARNWYHLLMIPYLGQIMGMHMFGRKLIPYTTASSHHFHNYLRGVFRLCWGGSLADFCRNLPLNNRVFNSWLMHNNGGNVTCAASVILYILYKYT